MMRSSAITTTGRNWTERHIRDLVKSELKKSGGGGGGTSDDTSFISSLKAAFNSINMSIQLSDISGTQASGGIMTVKPSKLCYRSGDVSSAKTLYCIYDFVIPALSSNGVGFPNIVMPNMEISQTVIIGNPTFAYGNIDVYSGPSRGRWRVEESGNMLIYYDYIDNFTEQYKPIQFPEHIIKAVMYEMMPNNTYRYNYNGIASMFDYVTNSPTMPAAIKPLDVNMNVDNLNLIFTILPTAYSNGKSVKISHMRALTKMPTLI